MGLSRRKTGSVVRPRNSGIAPPQLRPESVAQHTAAGRTRLSSRRYVPLWCKTNFSFLEGASHPEELVERAWALALPAVAITDRDGLYGIVRAHVKAKALGIHLLIGAQVSLEDGSLIVLIVADGGYHNLCQLLSRGRLRSPKGCSRVSWDEVCRYAQGVIALWGGPQSLLARETVPGPIIRNVKDAFGDRIYALCCRHKRAEERRQERFLTQHAKIYGLPVVAATEVLYHTPERRPLHDVQTCLRTRCTLSTAGRHIKPNAEHTIKSSEVFFATFSDKPQWVERTLEVARRCTFSLDQLAYRYPSETLPDGTTSWQRLRRLTFEGAKDRYPVRIPRDVRQQLDRELELIDQLDFSGYFLTMWDIVQFCRRRHILCQGRGSAANSAVCYCLGITAIDPVRMNLLFERFISRQRAQPPDIDLDIEHKRREEVIQYVYKKYGRRHAAMVAADYSPDEADQLRRDMAAWRRRGCIERHRSRLVSRMTRKGITRQFAEKVFEQIRGFGEYGFPESHAASFALISYATAWMRCHYPAEFICGLLNAQSMGFYRPATIVQDARRTGVEVRPVDVTLSYWNCTLEPSAKKTSSIAPRRDGHARFVVRMGLRFIKGLAKSDVKAMIAARKVRPFKDLSDFVARTAFDVGALKALAQAGAFAPFGLSRRQALWQVAGLVRRRKDSLPPPQTDAPCFGALNISELIDWDHAASAHSTHGHLLKGLRARLRAMGLPTAQQLAAFSDGCRVHYAGVVICRQRPATAGGVVFMTLEDETGFANLVVWKNIFKQHEAVAKTASFLGVTGTVQHQQGVTHLVAQRLWIPRCNLDAQAGIPSRDFH
ncbi:MAG: PHP domain-containing protein [Deltaproteobacteria bacterium]|nr:PHP domain-containing protein [Deltaproteobacteria bacterium]